MFRRILLLLSLPLAMPALAAPSSAVERLVAFTTDGAPDLAGEGRGLVAAMWTDARVAIPGDGMVAVTRRVDPRSGWTENAVPLAARWHGLDLVRFTAAGLPESGVGEYRLSFTDAPESVRTRAAGIGLTLGERTDEEGCTTRVDVTREIAGSSLRLAFAC